MRKLYIILMIVMVLGISLFVLDKFSGCIGCGTYYTFSIIKGCEVAESNLYINRSTQRYNIHLTDELLDTMVIKSGFPVRGLKKESLSEYCKQPYYPCDDTIIRIIISRCNLI